MTRAAHGRTAILTGIAHNVDRLAAGWSHVEILDNGRRHAIDVPSLIDQLAACMTQSSSGSDEEGPRSIPDSRPPVPEEPFSVVMAIHAECRRWRAEHAFRRSTDADVLRALVGIAPNLGAIPLEQLGLDIESLRHRAETALSWRLRSRRLRGCCPACDRPGVVYVRLDDYGPTEAYCAACEVVWDKGSLGVLAGSMG